MHARYYDPQLGQFLSPDTLVPDATNVMDYDRYLYGRGNPMKYNDPTGHYSQAQIEEYLKAHYGAQWQQYLAAWSSDTVFWGMLGQAQTGDALLAPTSPALAKGSGTFIDAGQTFDFVGNHALYEYQGYGPYRLVRGSGDVSSVETTVTTHPVQSAHPEKQTWEQPLYHYGPDGPVYSGFNRRVSYTQQGSFSFDFYSGDSLPWLVGSGLLVWAGEKLNWVKCPWCAAVASVASGVTGLNNSVTYNYQLSANLVDKRTYLCPSSGCSSPQETFIGPDPTSDLLK